jgi:hypothetical protein
MKNKKSKALIFANVLFSSIIIISSLAIFYLWYRSISLQIPLNLKLVIILVGMLLFSIITLYLRDNWKINLAVATFSIIVSAYSVEFVLFVLYNPQFPQTETQEIQEEMGSDRRSKLEVIEDLRAEGVDAWPLVLSWLFTESNGLLSEKNRIFPLGGISNKTIVYCNESGQYKIFKSDEHGFNNPRGLYKKGEIKIALIGDSFTIGSCVKEGEDMGSLLRSMGFNVLNLGNGGNGPLIELATLKEYAEPIQPEIVLWVYYEGNDLNDLENERKASMLMQYLEDDYHTQNLLKRQDEIDAALIKYVNSQWIKNIHLHATPYQNYQEEKPRKNRDSLKIIKLWHLRSRLKLLNPQKRTRITNLKKNLSLFSEILTTANQWTSDWGGKFYFVYLPSMERYINDNNNGNFCGRDDVLAIVHKLGIPLIDFHEVLNKHPDPLSLTPFLGAHYNAEGYKLLSDFIIEHLRKDGVI